MAYFHQVLRGEKMNRQIALLTLAIFIFLPADALSQAQADAFSLSISAEQDAAYPYMIKVRGKIENKSGETASLDGVTFNFRKKHVTDYGSCHRGECLIAGYAFKSEKSLKQGESIEFEVDLSDLYWTDAISSTIDLRQPKGAPPVGGRNQYLFMALHLPAENSTRDDPRTIIIKSNEILMHFRPF
jgi:hypothetical protein